MFGTKTFFTYQSEWCLSSTKRIFHRKRRGLLLKDVVCRKKAPRLHCPTLRLTFHCSIFGYLVLSVHEFLLNPDGKKQCLKPCLSPSYSPSSYPLYQAVQAFNFYHLHKTGPAFMLTLGGSSVVRILFFFNQKTN